MVTLAFSKKISSKISDVERLLNLRNIGISAHIDSGKTTLTERILYYTGKISNMHEVRGRDGIGAKMDSMELEREKGITIQSAATSCLWKATNINIIDTPGHVDFTIEVERSLRVLDGAILVLCGVSGVQSQTITVDRQMRRYNIPRVAFVNKLDRIGANPFTVIDRIRNKLKLNASAIQIPIGNEGELKGIMDLIDLKGYLFGGTNGENVYECSELPMDLLSFAKMKRKELIENLASVDDIIGETFLNDQEPEKKELLDALNRSTISRKFLPVLMGSAYKNIGIQLLLDAVTNFLPNPSQVSNHAYSIKTNESIPLYSNSDLPFIGLAFKLENGKFGQLTYIRIYQGKLSKGDYIFNVNQKGQRVKVPRLVKMHANEMEDVTTLGSGEICAVFGIDCSSGDTFTSDYERFPITSSPIYVPAPVISLAVKPLVKDNPNYAKALSKYQKEDLTFKVHYDQESGETIWSGMGELHLEVYLERIKREYDCACSSGKPKVAFRETINNKATFDYLHKKQSGGAGQFARVAGFIEPTTLDWASGLDTSSSSGQEQTNRVDRRFENEFVNETFGGSVPSEFVPACEKGFRESTDKGALIGHPVVGTRMVIDDGSWHVVDSNEYSFRTAAFQGFRQAFLKANPLILEPIMRVTISIPIEFQGIVMGTINKRKGTIFDVETLDDAITFLAHVPLNNMFGYSTELRSITQGKGEFNMEYYTHAPVATQVQNELVSQHKINFSKSLINY